MVFKFWLFVVSFRLLKKKIQGGAPGFFSAEPGDSKGLVLWSEKEEKDSGGGAVGPELFPESPRGPGVQPRRSRERSVNFVNGVYKIALLS